MKILTIKFVSQRDTLFLESCTIRSKMTIIWWTVECAVLWNLMSSIECPGRWCHNSTPSRYQAIQNHDF